MKSFYNRMAALQPVFSKVLYALFAQSAFATRQACLTSTGEASAFKVSLNPLTAWLQTRGRIAVALVFCLGLMSTVVFAQAGNTISMSSTANDCLSSTPDELSFLSSSGSPTRHSYRDNSTKNPCGGCPDSFWQLKNNNARATAEKMRQ
jgi:hypothetical protein